MNQLQETSFNHYLDSDGLLKTEINRGETQSKVNILLGLEEGMNHLDYLKYKLEMFYKNTIAQNLSDEEKIKLQELKEEIKTHEKCVMFFLKNITKH